MIQKIKKTFYFLELIYVLKLSFSKFRGLYVVYVGNILSILIELLAIAILSSISQQNLDVSLSLLRGMTKEELFIVVVSLFLVRFLSMFILESAITYYAKEMQVYLSSTAFQKVVFENIKDIEKVEIGHYITLSGDEASNASQILISTSSILNNLLLVVAYLVAVVIFAKSILIWLIFLFLLIALLVKIIYKKIFFLGHQQSDLRRSSSSIFMDAFNSLRIVKAFTLEHYVSQKYKEEVHKYFTVNSLLLIYGNLTKYIPIILLFLFFELYLVVGYINGELFNITFLVTLLFMMMRLLHAIGTLSNLLGKIAGELKGIKNLVEFIRMFYKASKQYSLKEKVTKIDIKNVSFSYEENKIFHQFNLSFVAGNSYAIYGQSGSGKSTLLDLMLDFISPCEGEITINGVNVKNIRESSLTKHVMYIGQESLVFNQSIKENIVLQDTFNESQLQKVLKSVQLDTLIEQYDDGMDHLLYYKGSNISGGQKQRINLARALIREPDVLILDESTSALDNATKERIVNNILNQYKDKIVIFVTHDLSILPLVNKVINLEEVSI